MSSISMSHPKSACQHCSGGPTLHDPVKERSFSPVAVICWPDILPEVCWPGAGTILWTRLTKLVRMAGQSHTWEQKVGEHLMEENKDGLAVLHSDGAAYSQWVPRGPQLRTVCQMHGPLRLGEEGPFSWVKRWYWPWLSHDSSQGE